MLDDNVGPALAEERLTKAMFAVGLAELAHPLTILGQAVIVDQQAPEAVALAELLQLAYHVGHAATSYRALEEPALRGLTEAAVVHAATARDDGHEGRRQITQRDLRRIQAIAEPPPLVQEDIA